MDAFVIGATEKGNRGFVQPFLYSDGRHLDDSYFSTQVMWLGLVSILPFGYDYRDKSSVDEDHLIEVES